MLSFAFATVKNQEKKEAYLLKAFNAYSCLWVEAVRYYASTDAIVKYRPTYSSDLRLLYRLIRRSATLRKIARKGFDTQLARHDVFSLQPSLVRTTKIRLGLCEAYAVLKQRRKLFKEFAKLQLENNDYERLLDVMDTEGLGMERFAVSGELPKKCDEVSREILLLLKSSSSAPSEPNLLKSLSLAKRLRQNLMVLKLRGITQCWTEQLLTTASVWITRYKNNRH